MATANILRPLVLTHNGNLAVQKTPVLSNITVSAALTFFANELVLINASGLLEPLNNAGVAVYGQTLEAQKITTAAGTPPTGFNGMYIYPINVRGAIIEMNVSDVSSTTGLIGSGSTRLADLTVGQYYACVRPTTGTYLGYQMIDASVTAATPAAATGIFFQYIGPAPGAVTTDYNGRGQFRIDSVGLQG